MLVPAEGDEHTVASWRHIAERTAPTAWREARVSVGSFPLSKVLAVLFLLYIPRGGGGLYEGGVCKLGGAKVHGRLHLLPQALKWDEYVSY
jgi:hypothetical protein